MRTVSGGGCWDLKCSAAPTNPGAVDGMAGLRGTNRFLEESRDFGGVAVSLVRFLVVFVVWDYVLMGVMSRDCIFSRRIRTRIS